MANRLHLTQVFQNLIGNALKYRSEQPPRISITAGDDGRQWRLMTEDNGIGIPSQYQGTSSVSSEDCTEKSIPALESAWRLVRKSSSATGTHLGGVRAGPRVEVLFRSAKISRFRSGGSPMIALLRGKLLEKHPNQVIVEAGGVGYDVLIPDLHFFRAAGDRRGSSAAHLHACPGRHPGAVRLSYRRRKDDLRETDLGQRHRTLAGDQGALRTWPRPI